MEIISLTQLKVKYGDHFPNSIEVEYGDHFPNSIKSKVWRSFS